MPSIDDNRAVWNSSRIWKSGGEEWSRTWGGTAMHWHGSVFPRIRRFLPQATILELGPGFGRLTEYLRRYAHRLIIVDMAEKCIESCKQKFAGDGHIEFHVNDGSSLEMIEDDSIDFVFSHDALTFAEAPALGAYIRQLARKLKRDGVAFIHHSNLGSYWYYNKLSQGQIKLLRRLRLIEDDYWRAYSVSASKVKGICHEVGLECIVQELTVFFTKRTLVDCFSLIVRRDSTWYRPPKTFRNLSYMQEAKHLARLARYYAEPLPPAAPSFMKITYDTVQQLPVLEKEEG